MVSERIHRVTTFDAEEDSPEVQPREYDLSTAPSKRRAGRPRGAAGKTLRLDNRLQTTDFHFLRAVIEGITPKVAADRYLAHRGPIEGREAATLARDLLRDVASKIDSLKEADVIKEARKALDAINAPTQAVAAGPSLDDFAAQYEEGMYSQAELLELYLEKYPAPAGVGAGVSMEAKRKALAWLMLRLATHPTPGEPCDLWVHKPIADMLKKLGVVTLGDLVAWINREGARWYGKLDGVGRTRAARILSFLHVHAADLGQRLQPRLVAGEANAPSTERTLTIKASPLGRALVPLDELLDQSWPLALQGNNGEYRGEVSNGYGAGNDIEAVHHWIKLIELKSANTLDSYRRAVERLFLWAVMVKGKPLSSLSQSDFVDYAAFLRKPPADWCSKTPAMRGSKDWRPLRGPMGEANIRQNFIAIGAMFRAWHKTGYLRINTVPDGIVDVKFKKPKMNVRRSFTNQDLDLIRSTMDAIPDGMEKRRLRAILLLLQTAGLRRAEAVGLTWGHVHFMREGLDVTQTQGVTFYGKGRKQRTVPLHDAAVAALEAHYEDRLALIAAGRLPLVDAALTRVDTPLLSVLEDRLTRTEAGPGMAPQDAPRSGNRNGALSASRLYGLLKAFFKKVAERPELANGHADFLKASTHWMRHTFAHQAVKAANGELPVVQALLGHADISTTGIYVKSDDTALADAVRALTPAV
jgi:site-specific recombinase XerD